MSLVPRSSNAPGSTLAAPHVAPDRRPRFGAAGRPLAVLCDRANPAGGSVATSADPVTAAALASLRDGGLLVAVAVPAVAGGDGEADRTDGGVAGRLGPVDVVAAPAPDELGGRNGDEVHPQFVRRVCRHLGVPPETCVVLAGRRRLLAAAAGAGAHGIMVPGDDTPPFEVRALPHVEPDLASAVAAVLSWTDRASA